MSLRSKIFLFVLFVFLSINSSAYPEFIGLGYTACMTCHYNGAGNGALNDYGRGLFAAEIAARPFWNSKQSDEDLSASSGFLGARSLPLWFRPTIKYRGLNLEKNPGSKTQKISKYYLMQQDFDLHISFNEEQTFLLGMNLGMVSTEAAALPNKTISETLLVSREYYLRVQLTEGFWIYTGFLDKVFGIRHADHTAVNRVSLGLGQNDQVHGIVVQYAKDQHELFLHPFLGNLHLARDQQFAGLSILYEYELAEQWRIGGSFMRDRNAATLEKNTAALILKRGLSGGHSILLETGLKNATSQENKNSTSYYLWTQATMRMIRGLFFQSSMEYSKADLSHTNPENLRWGLGLLVFPLQRVELRLFGVTGRTIDPTQVMKDTWALQSQLHLAF